MKSIIDNLCKELENKYNLIVMWHEFEPNEDYIELKIWNDEHELLKHCFNTQLNIINMLRGIKFGIQATLNDDIHFE